MGQDWLMESKSLVKWAEAILPVPKATTSAQAVRVDARRFNANTFKDGGSACAGGGGGAGARLAHRPSVSVLPPTQSLSSA